MLLPRPLLWPSVTRRLWCKRLNYARDLSDALGTPAARLLGRSRLGVPTRQFSPHGCGVMRGAKVGNTVGEGVADAPVLGVATCACAPAKKATKPTKTHTQMKAIPSRIRALKA